MNNNRVLTNLDAILSRIREKIVARGSSGIKGLGRLFRIADDNGDRKIDLHNELPKFLGDIGVLLNKTEINELARLLDRNGDGTIDFEEFIFYFAPPLNERRMKLVNKAFDKMDANGNGIIEVEDLKLLHPEETRTVSKNGNMKSSAEEIFQNLLKAYSHDGDKEISKQEFIDYFREMSASIDHDEMFEELMIKAWGIEAD